MPGRGRLQFGDRGLQVAYHQIPEGSGTMDLIKNSSLPIRHALSLTE